MIATRSEGGAAPRPVLPTRARALFLVLVSLLATLPAVGLAVTAGSGAEAHATPVKPGGRTFLCRRDAPTGTGGIKPVRPACRAAAQAGGITPFSHRFSVLRSDGAGRTRGLVPDGRLRGGGNTGFDTPGADRPPTRLAAGATGGAACDGQDVTAHDAGRTGSLGPGEGATSGRVVPGPGGDGATSPSRRAG